VAPRRGKAPRQARSKATVDAIVEATGQVFERGGYRRTTAAKVAARAGVSVGSLYQYFPDKEAMIAAFFDRRLAEDIELMQAVAARAVEASGDTHPASPVALLRIAVEEMVALYRKDRALYVGVAEILPMAEQTPEVREGLERAVAMTLVHLRMHPELARGRDPELLSLLFVHSLRACLFKIIELAPDKLDDPHLTEMLTGAALGLLGLPPDAR
jgi:AcrR family transcriptional regulator